MQKTKSERLTCELANVMQMKCEHLINMKAKSERLICRRRSLNVCFAKLAKMQMKSEHLINMKAKSERLIRRRRSLICCASKCDADEV